MSVFEPILGFPADQTKTKLSTRMTIWGRKLLELRRHYRKNLNTRDMLGAAISMGKAKLICIDKHTDVRHGMPYNSFSLQMRPLRCPTILVWCPVCLIRMFIIA